MHASECLFSFDSEFFVQRFPYCKICAIMMFADLILFL